MSLAFGHVDGDDAFEDDEDRRAAWEIHRDELMQRNGTAVPGHRPAGYWDYDAPDAPAREAFLVPASWPFPGERVDSEAFDEAELRYLAERGLLDREEIARLAAEAERPYEAPDGIHRPRTCIRASPRGLPAGRGSGTFRPIPTRRDAMRMLLKAQMDTQKVNQANREGTLQETLRQVMDDLQPEAAYFYPEDGKRTMLLIFDMQDPSQIPPTAEPLFQAGEASISLTPVMNIEDLQSGLQKALG